MSAERPLTRTEWNRTPYSGTTANSSEADIVRLLDKYEVPEKGFGERDEPDGRKTFCVRFRLKDQYYRLEVKTLLTTAGVSQVEKVRQVKRAAFYALKSLMELTNRFMPADVVLLPFAEITQGGGVRVQDVSATVLSLPRLAAAQANNALEEFNPPEDE